jgi:LAGLIDADG endonuclease
MWSKLSRRLHQFANPDTDGRGILQSDRNYSLTPCCFRCLHRQLGKPAKAAKFHDSHDRLERQNVDMGIARVVLHLSPTDAAYIAGIVDGEGTISLTRRHRNENRQLEVSISNTDINLLQFVKERIGAGQISKKRTYRINHTASATYSVSNRQALSLLEQLYPYLKTYKAERARLALAHYLELTPRNGFYTDEILRKRDIFIKTFLRANPLNQDDGHPNT